MSMETGRLSMTSDRLKKLRERVEEVNKPIPFLQVLSNGDWNSLIDDLVDFLLQLIHGQ